MKKLTIALIICAMLAAPLCSVSAASCASYIYTDSSEVSPGQTLQFIFAADCNMVSGISAEISLPDNLTIISAKGLRDGWDFAISGNTVVMYDLSGELPVSGENEFFEVTVKVSGESEIGDEVNAFITAKLATVENGYKTVDTTAEFYAVLQECQHYNTVWNVVTPPSNGAAGVKVEYCLVCGEILRQEEISFLLGDTDLNGDINVADAVLIARYTSNLAEMTAAQLESGDVDGSGFVSVVDAVIVTRYAAKLINKFPV